MVEVTAIRNIQIDFYTCASINKRFGDPSICRLTRKVVRQTPVLRIFGPTLRFSVDCNKAKDLLTRGSPGLLHVHGFLPYFYCDLPNEYKLSSNKICSSCDGDRFKGQIHEDHQPQLHQYECCKICHSFVQRLESRLSSLLNVQDDMALIYNVELVSLKSIYGYQPAPRVFAKITCFLPRYCAKLASILAKWNDPDDPPLQVYELHVPYVAKFLAHYEISGEQFQSTLDFHTTFKTGPEWIYFFSSLVPMRPQSDKASHHPDITEWDIYPQLFLPNMRAPNGFMKLSSRYAHKDKDITVSLQSIEDLFRSRYSDDFSQSSSGETISSPTDALHRLWTAELRRRQRFRLVQKYPIADPSSYLATQWDEERAQIKPLMTLPQPSVDTTNDLLRIFTDIKQQIHPAEERIEDILLQFSSPNEHKLKRKLPYNQSRKSKLIKLCKQDVEKSNHWGGFVEMPYYGRSEDIEEDKIFQSVIPFGLDQTHKGYFRKDTCDICDGSSPNSPRWTRLQTCQTGTYSKVNPQGIFHGCPSYRSAISDQVIGQRKSLESSGFDTTSFIYAKRPPSSSVASSELDCLEQCSLPPRLDIRGRLLLEDPQARMIRPKQSCEDSNSESFTNSGSNTPSAHPLLRDTPSPPRTPSNSVGGFPLNLAQILSPLKDKLEDGDFEALSSVSEHFYQEAVGKISTTDDGYFYGLIGRVCFVDLILDLKVDGVVSTNSSQDALASYTQLKRERGNPLHDSICGVLLSFEDISSMQSMTDNSFEETLEHILLIVSSHEETSPPFTLLDTASVRGKANISAETCIDEAILINKTIETLNNIDPDIILQWDLKGSSLGFFLRRAAIILQDDHIAEKLSRIHSKTRNSVFEGRVSPFKGSPQQSRGDVSRYISTRISKIPGRILMNLSTLIRSEVKVNNDSFYNILRATTNIVMRRLDLITLSLWWTFRSDDGRFPLRLFCIRFLLDKLKALRIIMARLDIVNKSITMSQVFGLEWTSTLTRGSQFFVESLLVRAARRLGLLLLTASKKQVKDQDGLEQMPMVLEPRSLFYFSPVIVLDYQSLYPSLIIAYNLCYSTCLGKAHRLKKALERICQSIKTEKDCKASQHDSHTATPSMIEFKMGVHRIHLSVEELLHGLTMRSNSESSHGSSPTEPCVYVMPNGSVFLSQRIKRGVLPSLLEQILQTRIMLKLSMKLYKQLSASVCQLLTHEQFSLKFVANVTYGYTGASFSGRMPCGDIADAIVSMARDRLQSTISMIESHPLKIEVVYGDTDSIFVHIPNGSVPDAFRIGDDIVAEATRRNMIPITLKLEKVYQTCCLQTKKRYVGRAFETMQEYMNSLNHSGLDKSATMNDSEYRFGGWLDSKGIETMRRDQCSLVQKSTTGFLESIFTNSNLSRLKDQFVRMIQRIDKVAKLHCEDEGSVHFLQNAWLPRNRKSTRLLNLDRSIDLTDFIFSKDVRLGTYAYDRHGTGAYSLPPQAVLAMWISEAQKIDPSLSTLESKVDCNGQSLMDETNSNDDLACNEITSDDENTIKSFEVGEQVTYLLASGHSSHRLNERVLLPNRIVSKPPLPLKHPALSSTLYSVWWTAIGQHRMFVDSAYYINNQVAQVIRRLAIMVPAGEKGLPIDNWLQLCKKYEVLALRHKTRTVLPIDGMMTTCASLMRGFEFVHDTINVDDPIGSKKNNVGCQPSGRQLKIPIETLTGAKTLEQFFCNNSASVEKDAPMEKNANDEPSKEIDCLMCKRNLKIPRGRSKGGGADILTAISSFSNTIIDDGAGEQMITDKLCQDCHSLQILDQLESVEKQKGLECGILASRRVCFNCTGGSLLEIENCEDAWHCPIYSKRTILADHWQLN